MPDTIFQLGNLMAMAGWAALLASPFLPSFADRIAGAIVPLLFAVAYTGIVLAHWASSAGGFDSLDNVALLFQSRWMLLAGWLHYLAFDLFVGAWIVREARRTGVAFWLVVPCLAATFLFGPAGYLLFQSLRFTLHPVLGAQSPAEGRPT